MRIDKWLWHARFYRSRPLAQAAAASGLLRINGHRVEKASVGVEAGDIITLPRGSAVLAIRVQGLALRRGPASTARTLYEIIEDPPLDPAPSGP